MCPYVMQDKYVNLEADLCSMFLCVKDILILALRL